MAKSGGMLNAICAKLLKTTNDFGCDQNTTEACDNNEEGEEPMDADDVENNNNEPSYKDNTVIKDQGTERMMMMSMPSQIQGSGQSMGVLMSYETESSSRAKPLSPQDPVPPGPFSNGHHGQPVSRRNRRKNVAPRSIAQLHEADDYIEEEIEEFEINNRGIGLVRLPSSESEVRNENGDVLLRMNQNYDDNEMVALDLSSSVSTSNRDSASLATSSSSVQIETLAAEEYMMDVTGALDLSVSKNSKSSDSSYINETFVVKSDDDSSCDSESAELTIPVQTAATTHTRFPDFPSGIINRPSANSSDANDMKNYAQNTMNELLSLYGIGKQEAESITDSVSLENFSSGNILARQTHPGVPGQKSRSAVPSSSGAGKVQKKGDTKSRPPGETESSRSNASSPEPQAAGEAAYSKFMENISKMTKLPQGSMLPDQMKEIILAAAMMKHKLSSTKPLSSPPGAALNSFIDAVDGASSRTYPATAGLELHPSLASTFKTNPFLPIQGKNSATNKFASSADYVKAIFSSNGKLGQTGGTGPGNLLPDYSKYVKRFTTYEDCKDALCKDMAYKEHFHCMDCNFKVFTKKEEMIRHFKWHKKREESLQHGFLRFSPIDDCSTKFDGCAHNGKQTHYHCLQSGCNKVYISTSDVQMHSNYHRKDSAIIQEGFQRFRATEDCGETSCSFYGQRTTHFHCRRASCQFTFKNKADMEKHKAYHQKDEALAKDGFKKFMKYEQCNFTGCKYSKSANHIHCIRPGCNYVLHSTGQLFSHKRKHEKRDFEHAYKRFKEDQKNKGLTKLPKPALPRIPPQILNITQGIPPPNANALNLSNLTPTKSENPEYIDMEDLQSIDQSNMSDRSLSPPLKLETEGNFKQEEVTDAQHSDEESTAEPVLKQAMPSTLAKLASKLSNSSTSLDDSLNLPIPEYSSPTDQEELHDLSLSGIKEELIGNHGGIPTNVPGFVPKASPPINSKKEKDETWKKYLTRYTANDPCHPRCNFLYKDHYHCNNGGCGMIFRSKDGVREHGRYHEQQDRITSLSYRTVDECPKCEENCPHTAKHYHCLWASCRTVVLETDPPFTRLEHHKIHEYARAAANRHNRPFNMYKLQTDAFRRRRGRPPKYPKNDIPIVPKINMSDEDITGALSKMPNVSSCSTLLNGFIEFAEGHPCPDEKCYYFLQKHYHCVRPRCHHATDRADVLNLHAKDFHNYINILEGFEFFDRNVNCRRSHCHNNKANKHFHCMRPRCDYSFVRYSTMAQHDKKHRIAELSIDTNQDPELNVPVSPEKLMKTGATNGAPSQQVTTNGSPLNLSSQGIKGTTMVSPLQSPVTVSPPLPEHSRQLQSSPLSSPVIVDHKDSSVVKTKGTYFPMSGLSPAASAAVTAAMAVKAQMEQAGPLKSSAAGAPASVCATPNGNLASSLINIAPKPISNQVGVLGPEGLPLQMLLQQKGPQAAPQLNWLTLKMKMHYGVLQNCGRPFCKLKKKDHYHCFDCNQAFSDPIRLRSHVTKHGLKVDKSEKVHQPMLNPALFANHALALPQFMIPPSELERMPRKLPNGSGIINITPEDANNYSANDNDDDDEFDEDDNINVSSSLNLNPNTFSSMLSKSANLNMNDDSQGYKITKSTGAQRKDVDLYSVNGRGVEAALRDEAVSQDEVEDPIDAEENPLVINEIEGTPIGDLNMDQNMNVDHDIPAEGLSNVKKGRKGGNGRRSNRKRSVPKNEDFIDSDAAYSKQRKIDQKAKPKAKSPPKTRQSPRAKVIEQSQASMAKVQDTPNLPMNKPIEIAPVIETDTNVVEPALEGFRRYPFGEECKVSRCAFRLSGSHWHCIELNCSFSLNDRSRATAHTQKHAQVKAMLGDDFEHYTAKSNCNRPDCEHAMSSAHFHCKKCAYITTITNKVQVHRRQHEREEYISRSGFVQYTGLTNCQVEWCTYSTKQTHYHCTMENCKHSTVGLAQMQAHKTKKHQVTEN